MMLKLLEATVVLLILLQHAALTLTAEDPKEDADKFDVNIGKMQANADNDIAFDLPDLIVTTETPQGQVQLEAFRSSSNDQILREVNVPRSSQLIWVSIGHPTFVATPNRFKKGERKLFHMSYYGFRTYVRMLTTAQRKLLADMATAKYKINIKDSQVVNLILSKLECSLVLYDPKGNKYLIMGKVQNFRFFPVRMDFFAPPGSTERKLFTDIVNSSSTMDLPFSCRMESKAKKMMTNTLIITSQQSEQIGLETKLFGPASKGKDTTLVTREQSSLLSREMYATLNIIEDYQMTNSEFKEAFIQGLISQVAKESFHFEPIDSVLASISRYGFDFSGDLKPDIIKRDLGSILKVEKSDEKSRIVLDKFYLGKNDETDMKAGSGSVGASYGPFGFKASMSYAKQNSKSSSTKTKALDDQLNELNTVSQNDVQWTIEGDRVVPKSLNVVQMVRSKLSKNLVFNRVRVKRVDAAFEREFALYTSLMEASSPVLDKLDSRITALTDDLKRINNKLSAQISGVSKISSHKLAAAMKDQQIKWKNDDTRLARRLEANLKSTNSRIAILSRQALKHCRLCFRNMAGSSEHQCMGSFNTCTPFNSGHTSDFIDDTDSRNGWCTYRWYIDCRV